VAALEGARFISNIQIMGITLIGSALLVLALTTPAVADPDGGAPSDKPDAAPPLVLTPNASGETTGQSGAQEGRPAPPSRDSKRSPMPDRLANDHWMQYYPMAPPTPPVPENTGTSGGGAKRASTIFGPTVGQRPPGGAPPDIPRDSVTRTPEDQMAPPSPSSTP
jgi:hypothetical protein